MSQQRESAGKSTVLVVDDNPEILANTARFLRARGLNVVVSESALGVSSLVRQHAPAVVVLDVMMPALDGGSVAKLLQGQAGARAVPVIFYSSMPEEELYQLTRRTPGASYVLKSEPLSGLYEAVAAKIGAA